MGLRWVDGAVSLVSEVEWEAWAGGGGGCRGFCCCGGWVVGRVRVRVGGWVRVCGGGVLGFVGWVFWVWGCGLF